RRHIRQRALYVRQRKSVVVDRSHIEIAAVAASGEIDLRHGLRRVVQDRINRRVLQRGHLVVLEKSTVGEPYGVLPPGPLRRRVDSMLPGKARKPGVGTPPTRNLSLSSWSMAAPRMVSWPSSKRWRHSPRSKGPWVLVIRGEMVAS